MYSKDRKAYLAVESAARAAVKAIVTKDFATVRDAQTEQPNGRDSLHRERYRTHWIADCRLRSSIRCKEFLVNSPLSFVSCELYLLDDVPLFK